jgi:hypothetical protein
MTALDTRFLACAYLHKLTERLGLACMQDTHPLCPLQALCEKGRHDRSPWMLGRLDVQIARGLGIIAGKDPLQASWPVA